MSGEGLGGARTLRAGRLSLAETVGQSVANIGPTLTPAINVSVVVGLAGTGATLAFAVATVGILFVAGSVALSARAHPVAGSVFVAIGRRLGPTAGAVAGWSMVVAYVCTAAATLLSADIFLPDMLRVVGAQRFLPAPGLTVLVLAAIVFAGARRDIRLSARLGLALEAVSVAVIIGITAIVVVRGGRFLDPLQLAPAHLAPARIASALVFATFSFVGFESAATLARESRDPRSAVPLAIVGSAAASGVFFSLICYFMLLAIDDRVGVIADSASPFTAVTRRAGVALAAEPVYFAAIVSSFACTLACANAGARMIFSMGRYGVLPRALARVHPRHATPHVAAGLVLALAALIACGLERCETPVAALGDTGTLATFGFVTVYLLLCIAMPLEQRAAGLLRVRHGLAGAVGAALMLFVLASSVVPWPAGHARLLPPTFACVLLFAAWRARGAARFSGEDAEGLPVVHGTPTR